MPLKCTVTEKRFNFKMHISVLIVRSRKTSPKPQKSRRNFFTGYFSGASFPLTVGVRIFESKFLAPGYYRL